jgi:hypothetical protein
MESATKQVVEWLAKYELPPLTPEQIVFLDRNLEFDENGMFRWKPLRVKRR